MNECIMCKKQFDASLKNGTRCCSDECYKDLEKELHTCGGCNQEVEKYSDLLNVISTESNPFSRSTSTLHHVCQSCVDHTKKQVGKLGVSFKHWAEYEKCAGCRECNSLIARK